MYINNTFKRVERKTFMWGHKNNFSIAFFGLLLFHIFVSEAKKKTIERKKIQREKTQIYKDWEREKAFFRILTFIWSNGDNVCSLCVTGKCMRVSSDCVVVLTCLRSLLVCVYMYIQYSSFFGVYLQLKFSFYSFQGILSVKFVSLLAIKMKM